MTAFVVVNPRAGRTARDWPRIEAALAAFYPLMTVAFTARRGDAARLVREALQEGHLEIVAVGGDGTVNEAVNGFFDASGAVSPDAVFAFVSSGSGDFCRSFGIAPGYAAGIARLKESRMRRIDIGKVACLSPDGEPLTRYFANVASFGLSGCIAGAVNRARIARLFGAKFAVAFHAAVTRLFWRARRIRLIADTGYDEIVTVRAVAVANGQYFGGGMRVAPKAEPNDGQFEIVVMPAAGTGFFADLGKIRLGEAKDARVLTAARLVAAPLAGAHRPVAIETDGESAGVLPASFEILPNALNLRC